MEVQLCHEFRSFHMFILTSLPLSPDGPGWLSTAPSLQPEGGGNEGGKDKPTF